MILTVIVHGHVTQITLVHQMAVIHLEGMIYLPVKVTVVLLAVQSVVLGQAIILNIGVVVLGLPLHVPLIEALYMKSVIHHLHIDPVEEVLKDVAVLRDVVALQDVAVLEEVLIAVIIEVQIEIHIEARIPEEALLEGVHLPGVHLDNILDIIGM